MPDPASATIAERRDHVLLLSAGIRQIEGQCLATLPNGTLMGRAAAALADVCASQLRRLPAGTPVLALCGPGNNGGDALLAAMLLADRGWRVVAITLLSDEPTADDARWSGAAWRNACRWPIHQHGTRLDRLGNGLRRGQGGCRSGGRPAPRD